MFRRKQTYNLAGAVDILRSSTDEGRAKHLALASDLLNDARVTDSRAQAWFSVWPPFPLASPADVWSQLEARRDDFIRARARSGSTGLLRPDELPDFVDAACNRLNIQPRGALPRGFRVFHQFLDLTNLLSRPEVRKVVELAWVLPVAPGLLATPAQFTETLRHHPASMLEDIVAAALKGLSQVRTWHPSWVRPCGRVPRKMASIEEELARIGKFPGRDAIFVELAYTRRQLASDLAVPTILSAGLDSLFYRAPHPGRMAGVPLQTGFAMDLLRAGTDRQKPVSELLVADEKKHWYQRWLTAGRRIHRFSHDRMMTLCRIKNDYPDIDWLRRRHFRRLRHIGYA